MVRTSSILALVFAMLTALLAPARLGFACPSIPQISHCPMMAALKSIPKAPCCAEPETPALSPRCCCNLQPAPEAPALPDLLLTGASLIFVLDARTLSVPAPDTGAILKPLVALATTAPRGPPLPFSSLRAPPSFS